MSKSNLKPDLKHTKENQGAIAASNMGNLKQKQLDLTGYGCPVCLELKHSMKLITTCAHSLCSDCASKCSQCPVCKSAFSSNQCVANLGLSEIYKLIDGLDAVEILPRYKAKQDEIIKLTEDLTQAQQLIVEQQLRIKTEAIRAEITKQSFATDLETQRTVAIQIGVELDFARQQILEKEQALKDAKNPTEKLSCELDATKEQLLKLRAQFDAKVKADATSRQVRKEENTRIMSENKRLLEEITKLKTQIETIKKAKSLLRINLEKQIEENKMLKQNVEFLIKSNYTKDMQLFDCEALGNSTTAELNDAREEIATLKDRLQEELNRYNHQTKELMSEKERSEALIKQLSVAEEQFNTKFKQIKLKKNDAVLCSSLKIKTLSMNSSEIMMPTLGVTAATTTAGAPSL
jgi:DNA repair exonuclease SbcCD ATPase subunit